MDSHVHSSLAIRTIYHLFMGIHLTFALGVCLHCFLLFRCWVLGSCLMWVWRVGGGGKFGVGVEGRLIGFALLVSLWIFLDKVGVLEWVYCFIYFTWIFLILCVCLSLAPNYRKTTLALTCYEICYTYYSMTSVHS